MKITFGAKGWDQYQYWRVNDDDMCRKVERLIAETRRTPFNGTGKPEPLRGDKTGSWSRRITDEHRLVYRVSGKGSDQVLEIVSCRFHYAER